MLENWAFACVPLESMYAEVAVVEGKHSNDKLERMNRCQYERVISIQRTVKFLLEFLFLTAGDATKGTLDECGASFDPPAVGCRCSVLT